MSDRTASDGSQNSLTAQKPSRNKERGANMVEYALLVGLIALICAVSIRLIGTRMSEDFSEMASSL